MKESEVQRLKIGHIYYVQHRNNDKTVSRRTRRAFVGREERFGGGIPCCVFSSRLPRKATVERDGDNLIYRNAVPMSEISIPLYDLVSVEAVGNGQTAPDTP